MVIEYAGGELFNYIVEKGRVSGRRFPTSVEERNNPVSQTLVEEPLLTVFRAYLVCLLL